MASIADREVTFTFIDGDLLEVCRPDQVGVQAHLGKMDSKVVWMAKQVANGDGLDKAKRIAASRLENSTPSELPAATKIDYLLRQYLTPDRRKQLQDIIDNDLRAEYDAKREAAIALRAGGGK